MTMTSGSENVDSGETNKKIIRQLDADVEFPLEAELRNLLASRVIGQGKSTDRIASIIASRMYSIAPRTGPLAVIYLSGPSGVGKTETCHALSEYFFGDSHSFVTIRGEDYQDRHASRNLFWSPKTYVGYGESTPLNDISVYKWYEQALEKGSLNPLIAKNSKLKNFSVVLIDEAEKMSSEIHQNFLGIFDKGVFEFPSGGKERDGDKFAQKTDFSNTIFILTSNIGEHENTKAGMWFSATVQGRQDDGDKNVEDAIRKVFSAEFRNRVTAFLCYEPLRRPEIEQICGIYVGKVSKCLEEYWIRLVSDDQVIPGLVDMFAHQSKTMEGWARGLQKIVQNNFDGVLARIIASDQLNDLPHGQIQINASYENNRFWFVAESLEQPVVSSSPAQTFGDMLSEQLAQSRYYRHKELDTLIQIYKHVSRLSYRPDNINYQPYLSTLEKKMEEYGFSKDDIEAIDKEVWEKVTRDGGDYGPRQPRERRNEEDIFYPFSLAEMRNLMVQLWKTQTESNNSAAFKKKITDIRLVLIQEAIRKTMIAFFGKSITKDQSIWIGREIHALYLQSRASLQ